MRKIILSLMLIALAGAAYSQGILSITLDVYKNDSVYDKGIKIKNNDATGYTIPGDYLLKITDEGGRSLWEKDMNIIFFLTSDPPMSIDHTLFEMLVPYVPEMKHVSFYRAGKLLFAGEINLCNYDRACDTLREDYLSCPEDCPLNESEGLCTGYDDGSCDPDCLEGIDPDCLSKTANNDSSTPTTSTLPAKNAVGINEQYIQYLFLLALGGLILFLLYKRTEKKKIEKKRKEFISWKEEQEKLKPPEKSSGGL